MTLEELTIENVKEAYKVTGLVPERGVDSYSVSVRFPPGHYACPLQAVGQALAVSWTEIPDRYDDTVGFYKGWEDADAIPPIEAQKAAFSLGQSMAKELLGK